MAKAQMRIRIKLKAFDHSLADQSAKRIVDAVERSGAKVSGPVPLPTKRNIYCVVRSPHIDKKSREHFEIRTHRRLIDVIDPTQRTIEDLTHLDLPAGVDVGITTLAPTN